MQSKATTDLQGVDISSVQSITDETLLFSKINFMYCRAWSSDHTGTGDSAFAGYVAKCRAHNCPVGAYYFATPFVDATAGWSTDAQLQTQAIQQCDQFISTLNTVFGQGNTGDLTPVVDIEAYYDKYDNQGHVHNANNYFPMQSGMTGAQLVTWVKAFRDHFWTQTGRRLGFYSNYYFLTTTDVTNGVPQGMGLTDAQLKDINYNNEMPLWLAQYDTYFSGTALTTPADFGGWTKWNAWQYSGTADASSYGLYHSQNQVDLDRCSDIAWLKPPPVITNWGMTDNLDGTLTITMTHPNTVDYIGTSVYQDNVWKKWIAKGTNSVTITGLTIGQTYTIKLMSEDQNHDMTATPDQTITMASPPTTQTSADQPTTTTATTTTVDTTGQTEATAPTTQAPATYITQTDEYWGTIPTIQYPQSPQIHWFTFNGLDSRDFGFVITNIIRPFLPPTTVPSVAVPNRAGAIPLKRNDFGVRNIQVDFVMLGDRSLDLRTKIRNLAGFLIYQTEQSLVFSDEPDKQYFARFNQTATDLAESVQMGDGKLIFTCYDPLAYDLTQQTHLLNGLSDTYHNGGTAPCYPILRAYPTADCSFIKFTNETTGKSITYSTTWTALDILMIDCKNNLVYRDTDKESFLENITLDSDFFSLAVGDNVITVSNQDPNGAGLSSQCRVYWTNAYY